MTTFIALVLCNMLAISKWWQKLKLFSKMPSTCLLFMSDMPGHLFFCMQQKAVCRLPCTVQICTQTGSCANSSFYFLYSNLIAQQLWLVNIAQCYRENRISTVCLKCAAKFAVSFIIGFFKKNCINISMQMLLLQSCQKSFNVQ